MNSFSELSKLFGHCKVEWHIDKFPFQTFGKEWMIQSPEFTISGYKGTRWCMTLRSKLVNERNLVWFRLRSSTVDSSSKCTWLNVKICNMISNTKLKSFKDELLFLTNDSEYEVSFGSIEKLLSKMNRSDDLFIVICHMIVYDNSTSREFGECRNEGLKLLSKNMFDLYKSSRNFDTYLLFDGKTILAHRAILCARNDYLCSYIDEYINSMIENSDDVEFDEFYDDVIIDFTDLETDPFRLEYKGMRKILAYLYTGDIRHVLEEPSFAVYDCASFLEIAEVVDHYKPDKLILKSTIDFEEYAYVLHGHEFENSRLIWHCATEESVKTYKLLLYPVKDNHEDYVPLFVKALEKSGLASLELDFVDESGQLITEYQVILADNFIDIVAKITEMIKELDLKNYNFEVNITIKLSRGIKISYTGEQSNVSVTLMEQDCYYECLSASLEYLFDFGSHRDTVIVINGAYFWVHKCILAVRCQLFSDMLETNEGEAVIISDFDPRTVSLVLTYLYTGFFTDIVDNDVINVYKAATFTKLPELKSMCSDWLKLSSETNKRIRCRVVRLAEKYKDHSLLKYVLNLLFNRNSTFLIPNQPFSFEDVNACRHCLSSF